MGRRRRSLMARIPSRVGTWTSEEAWASGVSMSWNSIVQACASGTKESCKSPKVEYFSDPVAPIESHQALSKLLEEHGGIGPRREDELEEEGVRRLGPGH